MAADDVGDRAEVQVVRSGEPLSLLVSGAGAELVETQADGSRTVLRQSGGSDVASIVEGTPFAGLSAQSQALLGLSGGTGAAPTKPASGAAAALALAQSAIYRYPRRADAPDRLRGERLPAPPADFEAHLAAYVDFSPTVLADRLRHRVQVQRVEGDLFAGDHVAAGSEDVWASLSPEAVADRAEQLRLRLSEANDRELHRRLLERFVQAIEASGAEPPGDEEERMQQLDLVLVRRPRLLRDAYRRLRHQQVQDVDIPLPAELQSDQRLRPAQRALYGVFPPDLGSDELPVANLLDADPLVRWWHRNPVQTGVGLYRWADGEGFFPDFVVCVEGRGGAGLALLEVKGNQLWGKDSEVDKSHAVHRDYGAVFMLGRRRGENDFEFLRDLQGKLQGAGAFSVATMRFGGET